MHDSGPHAAPLDDDAQLAALGYSGQFERSMGLWANMALGFTYLSPLVGVYSLFAYSLSIGGPPAIWWIVIVGAGQLLVSLVFGEVVSQYPLAGGIYPWARRLWNRRYAWIVSWVYIWAIIVTVTSVAQFGGGFVAALFSIEATPGVALATAVGLLALAFAINYSGTRTLARIAKIGLAAELIGVIVLGLYLLLFQREQPFSIFFDTLGTGEGGYLGPFLAASLSGLFLFYGFEACGDVAEEVSDPTRRIPRAMILTILVGGVSGLLSYAGYVLAAPNLPAIVAGEDADPIPSILESTLGTAGSKVFLVVTVTAFISCVLSLQAAGSRLLYAFARDRMLPASGWLAHVSSRHAVPTNALLVVCVVPMLICLFVFFQPDALPRVTAFAVLGIYIAFQAVVLAALRQRLKGWRPAGLWNLGSAGLVVNVLALAYGIFAIILLIKPAPGTVTFLDRWIVAIGLAIVAGSGLLYLFLARPDRHSADIPEGDAREVAAQLRQIRRDASPGAARTQASEEIR
ncbi:APC family permease [Blastococcus sp. SYSU D00669]